MSAPPPVVDREPPTAPVGDAAGHAGDPTRPSPRPRPRASARRRTLTWVIAVLVVVALVVTTVLLLTGAAGRARADDPDSTIPAGNGALAQLLRDDGVSVRRTTSVDETLARTTAATTLVVANADRLDLAAAGRLARAPHARLILLRPSQEGLAAFGAAASTSDDVDPGEVLRAACDQPVTRRAPRVSLSDSRSLYRPSTPGSAQACYRSESGAAGLLRVPAVAGTVDLVAGGTSNEVLAEADNAAFAMITFGEQPDLIWLMAPSRQVDDRAAPAVLPSWWSLVVAQLGVAVVVAGLWRGRRLGPVLTEALPVTVRASETVEGHGRLYHRIQARDRAAAALRSASRRRLGAAYGHRGEAGADDPYALALAIAARTGRPEREVVDLLTGPAPADEEALVALARDLDRLEAEARQL